MRSRGSKMSKIIEVEQPWKIRKFRRNRKWREGPRKMQKWSTKIIKVLDDDDLNGRTSPCSVVSFSLSLDNQIKGMRESSEWIRTAHIKNTPVNKQDRRSPLFTGRMLRMNDFPDDIGGSRHEISFEFHPDVEHNSNRRWLSIRERLEPPQASLEPSEYDNALLLESSGIDSRHHLKSSSIGLQQRLEAPLTIRQTEPMGIALPPEHLSYEEDKELSSHPHPRFIRDGYNVYEADRFPRDRSSLSQRPRFRRSLYFPPGYSSPPKPGPVRRQKSIWPWLKTPAERAEDSQDHAGHYIRRDRVEYSTEGFDRGTFLPPGQKHYEPSEFYRSEYFDHSGGNRLRESRSEISLPSHEVRHYSDYHPEAYENEMNYGNRREDGRFDWPYSQIESYRSSLTQQMFYGSSRPSPFSQGSSQPPHDSVMGPPQYRSLMQPTSGNWEGAPGHDYQFSYQDRISDEDFTDSDPLDSEGEEPDDNPKKKVRRMWKNLEKERGILVSREGTSAAMTREHAEHVKKVLVDRAADPKNKFPENWKPRFLRTGLVHRSGLFQMICQDQQTVAWTLRQSIPPLDGSEFKILKRPYDWDCGPVRISIWLASEPANPQEALHGLDVENPGVRAANWSLVSVTVEDGWRQFVADVSRESALYLENNGWTLLHLNNLLPVTRLRDASKQLFFNQLAGDNP